MERGGVTVGPDDRPDDPGARALTGLRGAAALLVMLHHFILHQPIAPHWAIDGIVLRGYLAVDLFFVLSGFVMARAYGGWFRADAELADRDGRVPGVRAAPGRPAVAAACGGRRGHIGATSLVGIMERLAAPDRVQPPDGASLGPQPVGERAELVRQHRNGRLPAVSRAGGEGAAWLAEARHGRRCWAQSAFWCCR